MEAELLRLSFDRFAAAQQEALGWTIILALVFGAIVGMIGAHRGGNGILWFAFGAVLGPFALPLPFLFAGRPCPYCRKSIARTALTCAHCRREMGT